MDVTAGAGLDEFKSQILLLDMKVNDHDQKLGLILKSRKAVAPLPKKSNMSARMDTKEEEE